MLGRHSTTICVATAAKGGIASVVSNYQDCGFAARHGTEIVVSHDNGSFARRQWLLAKGLQSIFRRLIGGNVRVVHCHVAAYGSFYRKGLFAELARAFSVPVIWHVHASELKIFHASQGKIGKFIIRSLLERAFVVIVLSESWRNFVTSIAPRAKIEVLPNFVSIPTLDTAREVDFDRKTILKLGLVGHRKGTFDLLRAFALVLKRHPTARLVIGGNGAVEEAERLADKLGIMGSVLFAGWVSGAEKERLLAEASIYVLPSYNEGLPVSILEAMARSIPVVTTPVGGIPELIESGQNGILVSPGDIDGLAEELAGLLGDTEKARGLGLTGAKLVAEQYSQAAVLPKLEEIYQRLGA